MKVVKIGGRMIAKLLFMQYKGRFKNLCHGKCDKCLKEHICGSWRYYTLKIKLDETS